ncbi:hypothetical protein [Candidatus Palauibacter sp.]|uniref:hypothetical protein n=1 Tax=Candidatus Palauibacter sp. TaxID=3101350 RepID=UPI003B029FF6
MHVNRRFLFGLALFALAMLTFGAVARVEAQMSPCVFCTDCGRQGKIGNHAWDAGSSLQVNSRGRGAHRNRCFYTGNCAFQHSVPCGGGIGGGPIYDVTPGSPGIDEGPPSAKLLAAVREAVEAGDALAAYRIARSQTDGAPLYYMPERVAIQARGCGDTIFLHIPLLPIATPELLAAIAADERGYLSP